MVLVEDTRQQIRKDKKGKLHDKHKNIHDYCSANGIEIVRSKLLVGDYQLSTNSRVSVDTKKDMVEVSNNLYQDGGKRFRDECLLAQKAGIQLIILIEDDSVPDMNAVKKWVNNHPNANRMTPNGERIWLKMTTLNKTYGVRWEFCKKADTGRKLMELLNG